MTPRATLRASFSRLCLALALMTSVSEISAAPPLPASKIAFGAGERTIPGLAEQVSGSILAQYKEKGLKAEELAFSFVDLSDLAHPASAHFRGDATIYPASVVKMFFLAAVHRQLEDGTLKDTPELRRAMRDMIVDSTNDATALVLDEITGTTGGPELSPEELKAFGEKRNWVNRYFKSLGYTGINVNQKTWNEGPYGREIQFIKSDFGGRNMLTSRACAELIAHIANDDIVTPEHCRQMKELLARDPYQDKQGSFDGQATNYCGEVLRAIPGAKLWSKAGWTGTARHDAAYIELPPSEKLPQGAKFAVSIFTTNHANDFTIIPEVLRGILKTYYKADFPAKTE